MESFQLLDIRHRNTKNSNLIFRQYLLKRFTTAYQIEDYNDILTEFIALSKSSDSDIPISHFLYISNNEMDVEKFWLDFYKAKPHNLRNLFYL